MPTDAHGLGLSTSSAAAVRAFDHAVDGYLKYRADASQRVAALIDADGDFGFAHCLKGYFLMLGFKAALLPAARQAAASARAASVHATARETSHVDALDAWIDGDLDRALALWERILEQYPTDVIAFRLHHFNAFWLGRASLMQATVERVLPRWSAELPGWGPLLACRAFAHEECGNYALAEASGRTAIELDPGDVWAAHAVAHVLEMQGRRDEGIAWLDGLERHWEGANNLTHHLWWHRGLFHLERGEFQTVLELYDRRFRNLGSPLTSAQPDLYIDVQNAASMLYRLEQHGVDAGARWIELADHAEQRMGDCLSAFTLPHWVMALVRAGRPDTARRMVEGMRAFTVEQTGTLVPIVRDFAVPICEALMASGKGAHDRAVDLMAPAIDGMYRLGGSHAQQEVLELVFLDAALKCGRADAARMLIERATGRHPMSPDQRIGFKRAIASLIQH